MKHTFLPLLVLCLFSSSIYSQINWTSVNGPQVAGQAVDAFAGRASTSGFSKFIRSKLGVHNQSAGGYGNSKNKENIQP